MFTPAVLDAARADAARRFPAESCGLVLESAAGAVYRPADNLADDPQNAFLIPPKSVLKALKSGLLLAVIHSHPHPAHACPSAADMRAQIDLAVPWGIVPVDAAGGAGEVFFFGDQAPRPWRDAARRAGPEALVGLPYRHGVTDCFSILRDYYTACHSLAPPDIPRGFSDAAPLDEHGNALQYSALQGADFGFAPVTAATARPGDLLLLHLSHRRPMHAGVLLAGDMMLHHPAEAACDPAALSLREPAARYLPHLRGVLRPPAARRP